MEPVLFLLIFFILQSLLYNIIFLLYCIYNIWKHKTAQICNITVAFQFHSEMCCSLMSGLGFKTKIYLVQFRPFSG